MTTPSDQVCRRRASASAWPQLRDLGAVTRDDEGLTAGNTVKDLSSVVAEFSNGDRLHVAIVSPVRPS